jgi:hypothetical protein
MYDVTLVAVPLLEEELPAPSEPLLPLSESAEELLSEDELLEEELSSEATSTTGSAKRVKAASAMLLSTGLKEPLKVRARVLSALAYPPGSRLAVEL